MNLGELIIKLGVKGDTKKLEKANKELEKAEKTQEKSTKNVEKKSRAEKKANAQSVQDLKKISGAIRGLSGGIKGVGSALASGGGLVGAVGAVVGAVTLAYFAIDKMVSSLSQANQQIVTFQRTTGISFKSLNKYASANAAVNYNSSIEGTAQSMQRVAQNLWDIRMGRGDISPYQELAYVGGKAFNPYGMSVEQVIENVREAIKGVDDIQATNIITRMGFAPDDLLMLRMSREEFEKINDMFLSPQQREAINQYALELKKVKLEFDKLEQTVTLDLLKPFVTIATVLQRTGKLLYTVLIRPIQVGFKFISDLVKSIVSGIGQFVSALAKTHQELKPILDILKMLVELIVLPLEDLFVYLTGGDSLVGRGLEAIQKVFENLNTEFKDAGIVKFFKAIEEGIKNLANLSLPSWLTGFFSGAWLPNIAPVNTNDLASNSGNSWNTSNNFNITTNQPMDTVAENLINTFTPVQIQYGVMTV